ncbi:MAG: ABC transporter substrate-binding protein [Planctomycetes bacterium]|nr:ABC transporter substrate-binding protein [Planctomycetota bacterium]
MTRRRWLTALIAVLVVVGAGVAVAMMRDDVDRPLRIVRLATPTQPLSAGVFLADMRDAYRAHGLDVRIQAHATGKEALDAMLAGEADLAIAAQTPLMHAVIAGEHLSAWAVIGEAGNTQRIIARADRGIREAVDLAGKTMAAPRGTSGQIFVQNYLNYHGIDPATVTLVHGAAEALPEMLTSGQVDAVCVWDPYASRAERALGDAVVLSQDSLYQFGWILIGRPELGPTGSVDRILSALFSVYPDLQTLDESEKAELARRCGSPLQELAVALATYHYRVGLDAGLAVLLEGDAELLYPDAAAERDFASVLDAGPLRRVDASAVAVDW